MKVGDLVVWDSGRVKIKAEYAIVKDVRDHNGIYPAEILLSFPLDGSEGWYLAESVRAMPERNDVTFDDSVNS
jgi:hypothetical protein